MAARSCLALVLAGCPALHNHAGKGGGVTVREDIPFGGRGMELDLYLPEKGASKGPPPFVVFVHGGFWRAQDRRYLQPITGLYGNVGLALARRGMAVVVPSYRLFPEATAEDQLADVIAAVRWAADHARELGADPHRLVLVGHSAGGHLVSLLAYDQGRLLRGGVDPRSVRGFVSLSGIYDVEEASRHEDPDVAVAARTLFGADYARYSPLALARRGAPKPELLAVVGGADYPMCRRQHAALAPAVEAVELTGLSHADMVLKIGADDDPVIPALLPFLTRVTR